MVQLLANSHTYHVDFFSASFAYLNRYPNPYAKHVKSSDTLESYVDDEGRLRVTRVVVKTGVLPHFIKPILGNSLDTWVIEKAVIDPATQKVLAYSANVDHRKIIKVEEFLTYTCNGDSTLLEGNVRFSSNFIGFKERIERWSRNKFHSNMNDSVEGFKYVMNKFKQRKQWQLV